MVGKSPDGGGRHLHFIRGERLYKKCLDCRREPSFQINIATRSVHTDPLLMRTQMKAYKESILQSQYCFHILLYELRTMKTWVPGEDLK